MTKPAAVDGLVKQAREILEELVAAAERGDLMGMRVKAYELRGVAETIRRIGDHQTEISQILARQGGLAKAYRMAGRAQP